jgi:hypothetical protein
MSSERELGDKWQETREADGAWICKLPASTTAGIPDWLLMLGNIQLWEAKKIKPGKIAYDPKQLSGAQRFFMRMIARYAPGCGGVLLLAEHGYVELPAGKAMRVLARKTFTQRMEFYSD